VHGHLFREWSPRPLRTTPVTMGATVSGGIVVGTGMTGTGCCSASMRTIGCVAGETTSGPIGAGTIGSTTIGAPMVGAARVAVIEERMSFFAFLKLRERKSAMRLRIAFSSADGPRERSVQKSL
jgi:hypothetical protein